MSEEQAVVVFTARSPQRIIREGGSQAWVLNAARAKQCTWLVCTQNRHNPDHEFSDATEAHGSAFLVGRISSVRETDEHSKDGKRRYLIAISEYALVDVSDFWDHDRNPVRYLPRSELENKGIALDVLEWTSMPQGVRAPAVSPVAQPTTSGTELRLTIAEARNGLAAMFGVSPDAVEITIRG
jgi:hypothetical protein